MWDYCSPADTWLPLPCPAAQDSLDRIVPEGRMYRHLDEGMDDMPAHVKVGAEVLPPQLLQSAKACCAVLHVAMQYGLDSLQLQDVHCSTRRCYCLGQYHAKQGC
jgi:hypothetical protein